MPIKDFLAIIYTTILTISALHMPQPLLPLLGSSFKVEMDTISLIMSATFIPLTVIPVISGVLLNFFSPRKMIIFAAAIHSFVVFSISMAENVYLVIFLRFIEGFLISAILTSNTTYIALKSVKEKIQFFMSYYIAFTIIGGLLGRVLGSIIANYFGWRACFQVMSLSLLVVLPIVYYFMEELKIPKIQKKDYLSFKNFKLVVFNKKIFYIYIAVFCLFFVFSGITNFLPFRIKSINKQASEMLIGLIYSGYITGIFISFIATKIIRVIGNERKTMLFGFSVYGFFLLILSLPNMLLIFIAMFGFCSGMFLVHSVASGYLNRIVTTQKSLVNGAYIAFYYSGGVVGSYLPGIVYKNFGWQSFIIILLILLFGGFFVVTKLSDHS
ncbi:MAG: MFS transporter [Thermodesulfovibrio sp.]|uniref:MFS transporter n=2 Tax=Thermodesulfovibrio TaxID=28261 RepID=A0A2J6WQY5_9BACT|nr:MAG: MFS transporter [Thermodesulfovibrio aggregans]